MTKQRSPVTWLGGKGKMTKKLLPLFPPHHIYVEVFGGAASMLFAKEPSPVEVYNDLDSGLVNFFRVVRDEERCARLYMKVASTPYSREEYERCLDTWAGITDVVERAYRWFVVMRGSMSGIFGNSWGFGVASSSRGMAQRPSAWLSAHELLARAHKRLMRVMIERHDWRRILATYDTPSTLFYLDPPYVAATRRSGEYAHELGDADHQELVEVVLKIEGMAVLSGYAHDVYKPLIKAGWKRVDFEVTCSAAGRTRSSGLQGKGKVSAKQARVESVWISPSAQKACRKALPRTRTKARLAGSPLHAYPVRPRIAQDLRVAG